MHLVLNQTNSMTPGPKTNRIVHASKSYWVSDHSLPTWVEPSRSLKELSFSSAQILLPHIWKRRGKSIEGLRRFTGTITTFIHYQRNLSNLDSNSFILAASDEICILIRGGQTVNSVALKWAEACNAIYSLFIHYLCFGWNSHTTNRGKNQRYKLVTCMTLLMSLGIELVPTVPGLGLQQVVPRPTEGALGL